MKTKFLNELSIVVVLLLSVALGLLAMLIFQIDVFVRLHLAEAVVLFERPVADAQLLPLAATLAVFSTALFRVSSRTVALERIVRKG